jgi:hypothetical protein
MYIYMYIYIYNIHTHTLYINYTGHNIYKGGPRPGNNSRLFYTEHLEESVARKLMEDTKSQVPLPFYDDTDTLHQKALYRE